MPKVGVIAAGLLGTFSSSTAGQLTGVPLVSLGLPNDEIAWIQGGLVHATTGADFVGDDTPSEIGWSAFGQGQILGVAIQGLVGVLDRDLAADEGGTKPQAGLLLGYQGYLEEADYHNIGFSIFGGVGMGALGRGERETNLTFGADLTYEREPGGYVIRGSLTPRFALRRTSVEVGAASQSGFALGLNLTVGGAAGFAIIVGVESLWLGSGGDPSSLSLDAVDVQAISLGGRFAFF
ncbi:MAG: hypothetical protein MJB57_05665 [Gemmatimonadetes bacterium]|nr:hypothetical protein [Gemmatimonadota bacterium]